MAHKLSFRRLAPTARLSQVVMTMLFVGMAMRGITDDVFWTIVTIYFLISVVVAYIMVNYFVEICNEKSKRD